MLLTKERVYWLIIKKQIGKKSIIAFKMSELVMISKDAFPYSKVWRKEESVISNYFQWEFLIVLRREDRSLLYIGQWSKKYVVDSTSAPHVHNGFNESWKLGLSLRLRRWLRPRRSLVRNLIPCGLGHSNTLLGEGLINFRLVFLKFP